MASMHSGRFARACVIAPVFFPFLLANIDVLYRLFVDKETMNKFTVSVSIRCYDELLKYVAHTTLVLSLCGAVGIRRGSPPLPLLSSFPVWLSFFLVCLPFLFCPSTYPLALIAVAWPLLHTCPLATRPALCARYGVQVLLDEEHKGYVAAEPQAGYQLTLDKRYYNSYLALHGIPS